MTTKRILVYGYFGYNNNQLDGQTIKTRNIYNLLKQNSSKKNNVQYFDSQIFRSNKFQFINLLKSLRRFDSVVFIGAKNNLFYIFPFFFVLSKLFNFEIHYFIVGGWLDKYANNKILFSMLRKIKGVYPETKRLTEILENSYGFNNVEQIYNFRLKENSSAVDIQKPIDNKLLKLVFMARVHPMKGVNTIFELDNILNNNNNIGGNVEIDIYGPVHADYKNDFFKYINRSKKIHYRGALQPSEIQNTLSKYDLMLFPTKYYTEGLPGSILDAYMAGIPVIATEWKYANEFIQNDYSGIITKFDESEEFISETINLINNPPKLKCLKSNVPIYRQKFEPEHIWKVIKCKLDL